MSTDAHPREALRATLAGCFLTVCAQTAFAALAGYELGRSPIVWLDLLHAAWAAGLAAWLWLRRTRPSVRECSAVFVLLALAYLPTLWVGEIVSADRGVLREPLVTHHFLMFGIALLSPAGPWLTVCLIAISTVSAPLLWATLMARHPATASALGEPWITLVFAGISAWLAVYRTRQRLLTHRLAHARAEVAALGRVARLFLAVRDRANTPLQTLELGTALFEQRHPDEQQLVEALRRAVAQLRSLSSTFAVAEAWPAQSEAPTTDLAREVEEAARTLESAIRDAASD